MQLKWAREAVRQTISKGTRNQPANCFHGLGLKLLHLVGSLEHYVMFVIASAWQELEEVQSFHQFA